MTKQCPEYITIGNNPCMHRLMFIQIEMDPPQLCSDLMRLSGFHFTAKSFADHIEQTYCLISHFFNI